MTAVSLSKNVSLEPHQKMINLWHQANLWLRTTHKLRVIINWAEGYFLSMISPSKIPNTCDSLGRYLHDGSHISGEHLRRYSSISDNITTTHMILHYNLKKIKGKIVGTTDKWNSPCLTHRWLVMCDTYRYIEVSRYSENIAIQYSS